MMRSSKRLSAVSLTNGAAGESQVDEDSFQFFADKHFQIGIPAQFSRKDLRNTLLRSTPESEKQAALAIWKVMLRFMGDMTDYRATTTSTDQPSVMSRLLALLGPRVRRSSDLGPVMARLYDCLGIRESERDQKRRHNIAPDWPPTLGVESERVETVNKAIARGGTLRKLKTTLTRRFLKDNEKTVLHLMPLEESLQTPLEQLHFIIGYGILRPDLRDEIYCQACRQLTKNPYKSSVARGWLLLTLLAGCVPPSPTTLKYIIHFLDDGPPLYTVNCKRNLQRTLQNGSRFQPPSFIELEAGLNKKLLEVSVTLMDGTMHTMGLDAATTSRELCQQLTEFIGLRDQFGFSIYIAMYTKVASLGNGNDHVMDSISQCEQIYRETEHKEGPAPWRLFFRKEMFSPWEGAASDSVATGLIFAQVVRGIMLGEYVCETDQQVAVLAAQQYYIEYGADISEDGLTALLPSYIPPDKLQDDDAVRLWRRAIIKAHRKLFDVSDANRMPPEKVKHEIVHLAKSRWAMSFSRYYDMRKLEGPDWPEVDLCMAVNWTGLYVMAAGNTIYEMKFSDIVEVSDGGTRLTSATSEVIMIILVSGATIKLASTEGDDVRQLILFLLNGLRQRSTFAVAVQNKEATSDGDLGIEEGDLIILGRPAGAQALVDSRCVGRNERTSEAGQVDSDHIYIIPTLAKPSENFLKLFKTRKAHHTASSGMNTSNA